MWMMSVDPGVLPIQGAAPLDPLASRRTASDLPRPGTRVVSSRRSLSLASRW